MPEELAVSVTSTDEKVQCAATARSHPAVTFDYRAPLGNGQGYTGLEGLLMSLGACSGTTLVYLLRKMNRSVSAFSVQAKGTRRDQPPTSLEKISLEFSITSHDVSEQDMQKALKLTETICPVWDMIKNNAEIRTAYRLVRD